MSVTTRHCEEHPCDGPPRQHSGCVDRRDHHPDRLRRRWYRPDGLELAGVLGGRGDRRARRADRREDHADNGDGCRAQARGLMGDELLLAVSQPAQVVDPRSRRQRLTAPALLGAGVLGASVLLHVRDPHRGGSWGYCPWLLLTGTYCPGCGGLRAVNDLTDGGVAAGASSNLLFVLSIPLLVLAWVRTMADRWRGVVRPISSRRHVLLACSFAVVAL